MDFDLDKAQKLLQQSARDFFSRECPTGRVRELMAGGTTFDELLWRGMADQGWLGMMIPESCGGLELSLVDLIAVVEEMGRACLPGPFLATLWASALIERAGNEGQKRQYLDAISAGDLKATVALLEEEFDWDISAVAMRADLDGREYRLNGTKHFVLDGEVADLILCVARCGADLLILPVGRGAAGLSIVPAPGIDQTRRFATITFTDTIVPVAEALAATTLIDRALEAASDIASVALCAEMLGGMEWALAATVEYAKTRQQFGRPIGAYQAVQHQCADIFLMTESARSAVYNAAWAVSVDDPQARLAVAVAKGYCSDSAREVGNRAIQVHGGIGFTWEHDLQLFYKRAKSAEILFGDSTRQRESIARMIIDENEG